MGPSPGPEAPVEARGFTLIELLIAVAIAAILAAVAIPSYADYVRRSRLTEAMDVLSNFATRMEVAYNNNGNYGVNSCAVAAPATGANFSFGCTLASGGQNFTATATGSGAVSGYAYSVDGGGNRSTTAFGGQGGMPKGCWLLRGTEC